MADGYLESHYQDYERKKAAWLKKQKKTATSRDEQNPWRDV